MITIAVNKFIRISKICEEFEIARKLKNTRFCDYPLNNGAFWGEFPETFPLLTDQ